MRKKIASMVFLSMVLVLSGCARQEAARGKDLTIELTDQEKSETTDLQINHVDDSKQINEVESGSYQSAEKKGVLISIDPGHQSPQVDMSSKEPNAPGSDVMKTKATGGTSGRYSGLAEYELNLEIALQLREKLEVQGYDVIMTRENNETAISNAERARLANEVDADMAIRIHANGSEDTDANGALVLIGSEENPYVGNLYWQSSMLGQAVLDAYCEATGMQNLGVQFNDTMTGINWSQIPVIILEMGFMTNQKDDLNMADPVYQGKMVEGIVDGVNIYCERCIEN